MPKIIVITGPPGAGKTTISMKLAEKAPKGVAISADRIRKMVKGGYTLPWLKTREAKDQRRLVTNNICDITKNSTDLGFDVFIDDVLPKKDLIEDYKKSLGEDIELFLILPSEEMLIKRLREREEEEIMFVRTKELREAFFLNKDKIDWTIIDNSFLTIEETINIISSK